MGMNWQKVKENVARVAPILGAAINPAVGGAVGTLIASALGSEATPEAIEMAMSADPDFALKLRQLESQHHLRLQELALMQAEAELKDVQHARESHKLSSMPAYIFAALTMIVGAAIAAILQFPIPDENRDVLYVLLGCASTNWQSSIQYWVGTTRSSAEKTRLLK